ncbi:hypothetical protein AVEN_108632-1 [Araneus ventricosus]|uniref:Paired domain-containing protein n=1 Tax=Araneus ventricosus TaxID=182803 RepID=A0A4Y2WY49_ARAVE|nr:hypothetical protein AVEN_108632-1 [Araneus ventricosus]
MLRKHRSGNKFASSDSSAESFIANAVSMSRRNYLQDEMRWRAVGMLQAGARRSALARELNVHRSVIHSLWNHYQRDQNARGRRGSGHAGESPQWQTTVAMCRTPVDTNSATAGVAALCCCGKAHIPTKCVAQTA